MSEHVAKRSIDRARKLGPWATALDTGPDARLNTFWQRRMAMLAMLNGNPRVSWRLYVFVAAGALAVLALPLVYFSRGTSVQADDVKQAKEPATSAGSDDKEPTVEFLPPLSKSEERILEALDKPVDLQFVETPLNEVIDYLNDASDAKIEIEFDTKALEDGGTSLETTINCQVKDIKLASALPLILEPLDLVAMIHNEVILITSSDKSEAELITRTYPVADLIGNNDYDSLVEAITSSVRTGSWEEVGGPATIVPVPNAKSLVISQSRREHGEVLELLRSLRAARRASVAKSPSTQKLD